MKATRAWLVTFIPAALGLLIGLLAGANAIPNLKLTGSTTLAFVCVGTGIIATAIWLSAMWIGRAVQQRQG